MPPPPTGKRGWPVEPIPPAILEQIAHITVTALETLTEHMVTTNPVSNDELLELARRRDEEYRLALITYRGAAEVKLHAQLEHVRRPSDETERRLIEATAGEISARQVLDDAQFERVIGVKTIQQLSSLIGFDLEGRMHRVEAKLDRVLARLEGGA
jgi:hypothetical protein